ncbi:hypothetical protein V8245_06470 [Flavobacterium columnare]|uniref:Uncharacterized protein n=1 Tax=Flavobacterium columnare (strain ATCC 49512 / CIP 103533 / TG 44/87) TaxID=1041826 RepID=G8X5Y8_FLACA|nr:hypothetical protein [Flavobacterium columnare]AEW85591.1 hypothetical protein FCOL_03755 [Flavobacterium columnare ATCC 49512]
MSRTRIVGGKITEIVGGEYNIYSEGPITLTSLEGSVNITARQGITHGNPGTAPTVESGKIEAKCVVYFRPKKDWKGEEYGCDWMRIEDTALITGGSNIFGDTNYEKIIVKQYKEAAFTNLVTDSNFNAGFYKTDPGLFNKLKAAYKYHTITWKNKKDSSGNEIKDSQNNPIKEDYFCTWISLYPKEITKKTPQGKGKPPLIEKRATNYSNTKATLSLIVDIEEEPEILRFEENKNFLITPMEIDVKGKGRGKHALIDHLTIECIDEFTSDQTITLNAITKTTNANGTVIEEKKLAGKLLVWKNKQRKKAKIVLVKVETNVANIVGNKKAGNNANQQALFEKYLHQALIDVKVASEILDMSTEPELQAGGKYITQDPNKNNKNVLKCYYKPIQNTTTNTLMISTHQPARFEDLEKFLRKKLSDKLKAINPRDEHKYDNHFIAFYFGEDGGYMDTSNAYKGLNGYSSGKNVMLFAGKNDQTAAHEFLHSFKLPHTFANKEADANAKFTFEYTKTENLLDYSHMLNPPQERYTLWQWQWIIANGSIT